MILIIQHRLISKKVYFKFNNYFKLFQSQFEYLFCEALVLHADVAIVGVHPLLLLNRGIHDVHEWPGALWVEAADGEAVAALATSHEAHDRRACASEGAVADHARVAAVFGAAPLALVVASEKGVRSENAGLDDLVVVVVRVLLDWIQLGLTMGAAACVLTLEALYDVEVPVLAVSASLARPWPGRLVVALAASARSARGRCPLASLRLRALSPCPRVRLHGQHVSCAHARLWNLVDILLV